MASHNPPFNRASPLVMAALLRALADELTENNRDIRDAGWHYATLPDGETLTVFTVTRVYRPDAG